MFKFNGFSIWEWSNKVIVLENSLRYYSIWAAICTVSIHLVGFPLAFVVTSIDPLVNSLTKSHPFKELAFVVVSVCKWILPEPVLFTIFPSPLVQVPCLHSQLTISLFFVIGPWSLVYITIEKIVDSLTVSQSVYPMTFIAIGIFVVIVNHFAPSILLVLHPLALVLSLIAS